VASDYGPHPDDYVPSLGQRGQDCYESSAAPTGITSSSSSVATTRVKIPPGDGKKRRVAAATTSAAAGIMGVPMEKSSTAETAHRAHGGDEIDGPTRCARGHVS
jgi:hypothetical protein